MVDGMLEDLRSCLRLPDCDLLVMIDACNSTSGFTTPRREHIGEQKIEVLIKGAAEAEHNAQVSGSSTDAFSTALNRSKLLDTPAERLSLSR